MVNGESVLETVQSEKDSFSTDGQDYVDNDKLSKAYGHLSKALKYCDELPKEKYVSSRCMLCRFEQITYLLMCHSFKDQRCDLLPRVLPTLCSFELIAIPNPTDPLYSKKGLPSEVSNFSSYIYNLVYFKNRMICIITMALFIKYP